MRDDLVIEKCPPGLMKSLKRITHRFHGGSCMDCGIELFMIMRELI